MKLLEVIHDHYREQVLSRPITIHGEIPEGWTEEDLVALIRKQNEDNLQVGLALHLQISILGSAYGFSKTTVEALTAVGERLNNDPDATHEDYKRRVWQVRTPGLTDGEKLLYTSQEYAQEMFNLYREQILPELICSPP